MAGVWAFFYRNPTNAVGGSFIFSLHGKQPASPLVSWFARTREHRKRLERSGCKLSMNEQPTALVGFGSRAGSRPCRQGMKEPPTALVGLPAKTWVQSTIFSSLRVPLSYVRDLWNLRIRSKPGRRRRLARRENARHDDASGP